MGLAGCIPWVQRDDVGAGHISGKLQCPFINRHCKIEVVIGKPSNGRFRLIVVIQTGIVNYDLTRRKPMWGAEIDRIAVSVHRFGRVELLGLALVFLGLARFGDDIDIAPHDRRIFDINRST